MTKPLPVPLEDIASIIAHCLGGHWADYICRRRVINLIISPDRIEYWQQARLGWVGCEYYTGRHINGIDFIEVRGARVRPRSRPKDFLIFDLKDGRTALWPRVP
jgi:hypothetical protein